MININELKTPDSVNISNLFDILRNNSDTEIGRRYGFADIKSEEEYIRAIPITDYSFYNNVCGSGKYTNYDIKFKLASSGTTGAKKIFPLTERALERYSDKIISSKSSFGSSETVFYTSIFRSPNYEGLSLLSSAYFSYLFDKGFLDKNEISGGKELLFRDDVKNIQYLKARLLLCDENIGYIQCIYLYDLLLILRYIEDNHDMLIQDIVNKECSVSNGSAIDSLLCSIELKPERIKMLKSVNYSGGFLKKILPELKCICGIGGNLFYFHDRAQKQYTNGIDVDYFAYASSECMCGVTVELNKAEYALLSENAYYEFLPFGGIDTVGTDKLKAGAIYEPVVTTFSGLYRYRMGDLIQITEIRNGIPIFKIIGRTSGVLDIAGEKVTEIDINNAFASTDYKGDFSVGVDLDELPARYVVFAEEIGGDFADVIDNRISIQSPDYDDCRKIGLIGKPRIITLKKGCISRHFSGGHVKPKTIIEQKSIIAFKKEAISER